MKQNHFNKNDLNLMLENAVAPLGTESQNPSQFLGELELAMANCSYGHEYALQCLDEMEEGDPEFKNLESQIDSFRSMYLQIRDLFAKSDMKRLQKFEQMISREKQVIFTFDETLH